MIREIGFPLNGEWQKGRGGMETLSYLGHKTDPSPCILKGI